MVAVYLSASLSHIKSVWNWNSWELRNVLEEFQENAQLEKSSNI